VPIAWLRFKLSQKRLPVRKTTSLQLDFSGSLFTPEQEWLR
jgi:hypothetical protein